MTDIDNFRDGAFRLVMRKDLFLRLYQITLSLSALDLINTCAIAMLLLTSILLC